MQLTKNGIYTTCSPLFLALLLAFFQGAPPCQAQEVLEPAAPLEVDSKETVKTFEYTIEGRPDPFVPFISPKATTAKPLDPNEIVEEDVVLSGMQLFEPGQLTLVAIMMTEGTPLAMVEDVTGKGYILRQGILIGRRGVVSEILPTAVQITETAQTRAGKKVYSTITMKLNKEGDE
ncbi:pilus assembly protein PilP [Desulfogranum mediterraneum]|uniref:pilus assembly protein PilP n=1 Tax=Desulfogranum mediterraneum TaxID=160661 RepID=UPI000407BB66|nr:pilus assembly protein PilP [Desulfogranum mediterraneum]